MRRREAKILTLPEIECRHRGDPTGETLPSKLPNEPPRLAVYDCAVHGACTLGRAKGVWSCQHCGQREPLRVSEAPPIYPGIPDPLPEPRAEVEVPGWYSRGHVVEQHQAALQAVLRVKLTSPEMSGDGIVFCGGGKYWPMICVAVRMTRKVTALPIRVYHRGEDAPARPEDLEDLPDVSVHDLTKLGPYRYLSGWESKTCAILDVPWKRVIYLDADAYLVGSPVGWLTGLADGQSLSFWQDYPDHDRGVNWRGCGLPVRDDVPCIQGGQLVLDRQAGWRMLVVAHWLNQHSDYFYRMGYGDQDMWRISLAATGSGYWCQGRPELRGPALVYDWGKKPLIVHRVKCKLWGRPDDVFDDTLPQEKMVRELASAPVMARTAAPAAFERVYKTGHWGYGELSGGGSEPAEAKPYVDLVRALAAVTGWQRLVDLGTGDGRIARELAPLVVTGVDVYAGHLERLEKEAGHIHWLRLDLDTDRKALPVAHLALCKDVLHHWPNALVSNWLQWAQRCRIWQWLLLTFDVEKWVEGADCQLGGYRSLRPDHGPLKAVPLMHVASYLHKGVYLLRCAGA